LKENCSAQSWLAKPDRMALEAAQSVITQRLVLKEEIDIFGKSIQEI
jgi:hypothetical protein